MPSRTGTTIAPQTLVELCTEVPNIVGVKDATGDISEVAQVMSLAEGKVDLYSGNDDQITAILSLGGKGVISVLSNILPQETHDIVASYLEAADRDGRGQCGETCPENERSRDNS